MNELLTNWTWIHTLVYVIGVILIFGGARLLYYFSDQPWTIEIRTKVIALSLFSWVVIAIAILAVIIGLALAYIKIDWNKRVKI